MLNQVVLVGRLTKEPELIELENGKKVLNVLLAVPRTYKNENGEYNDFLNDIGKYPHAFVLACLTDKQMKAERAWKIPCKVYDELGNFDINYLAELPETTYIDLFLKNKYHRFNEVETKIFIKLFKE